MILYEQNGEVFEQQPIGHTDDNVSFFNGMSDTDVTFSRALEDAKRTEMVMRIGDTTLTVEWEDNESVAALREFVSEKGGIAIQMSMYGGFEQVGSLGTSLPRSDEQTTTQAGDIVLYSGNQIVVFYGSNSWAYTRLGRITGKTAEQMKELLGDGDVTIMISFE